MTILLDTHVFLWFIANDSRLDPAWANLIQDPLNAVYISVATPWELAIKVQLGKLTLPQPASTYVQTRRSMHGIQTLPVDEDCIAQLEKLPLLHRDPFDRILLAQALQYGLNVATVDSAMRSYTQVKFL